NTHRGAADPQREDLGDHQPEDRSEADGEAADVDDQAHEGEPAGAVLDARDLEVEAEDCERDHAAGSAAEQEHAAADAVDERHSYRGEDDVRQTDEDRLPDRAPGLDPGRAENRGRVVDDRVDADDLLEDREAEADDQHRTQAATE